MKLREADKDSNPVQNKQDTGVHGVSPTLESQMDEIRTLTCAESILKKQTSTIAPVPRLLGVADAAHYLGATQWSIRKLQWERAIPFIRIGQRVLFDIADLNAFIERQKEITK